MSDRVRPAGSAEPAPLAFERVPLPPPLDRPGARIASLAAFGGALILGTEATLATGTGGSIVRLDLARGDADEVVALPPPDPADVATWRSLGGVGDAEPVGRVTGFAAFQGEGDEAPCLYAATASLRGGELLRSETGVGYVRALAQRRRGAGLAGFVGPVAWGGRLALAPWAEDGTDELHLLPLRTVVASANPLAGTWVEASPPGFGDRANGAITALAAAGARLLAGTENPERGFQLWAAGWPAGRPTPEPWARLLDQGAHRFAQASSATALAARGAEVFVATAARPDGVPDVAPPGAELLRVASGGAWDIVAGETRPTPDGLRVPLALLGPGLGEPRAERLHLAVAGSLVLAAGSTGALIVSRDGIDWTEVDTLRAALAPGEAVGAILAEGDTLYAAAGARLLRARLPAP